MLNELFESPADEAARLALSPVGSADHALAALPVNIEEFPRDLLILLPDLHGNGERIIVVPFAHADDRALASPQTRPLRRHAGYWRCLVVSSNNAHYPAQGSRLVNHPALKDRACNTAQPL
ncbi:hypothetical protein ACXR2T_08195 [Leucobacter sp. HY1910]